MKTITVRHAQHHLAAVLDEVSRGETIAITRRGTVVARLTPPADLKSSVKWPDHGSRMARLAEAADFGTPASEIIDANREERF
jgi:prevent-host-death family protein